MNIQQLRVFAVAAQCKSLTEAAEALGIKQPTVRFHLKKLETALGVELFYKQPRHFRLTEAGNALLPYARRVSTLLTEAGQIMEEFRHGGRGTLKIGASYTPATYFLPPLSRRIPGGVPACPADFDRKKSAAAHGAAARLRN